MKSGKVFLVGAGCGAGACTVRGVDLLRRCDCVVYDSLLDESLLEYCRPTCRKIFVGKRAGTESVSQEQIGELLQRCAETYPLTVRLKGGDPFVFGRGGEEWEVLAAAGVECQSVPGVTSAVAAAELAGIPLTLRGVSRGFRVIAAHTAEGIPDFTPYARDSDTLVFLMAKGAAAKIAEDLQAGGMRADRPAAVISCAGSPEFAVRRGTLAELAHLAQLPAPLVILVGEVCAHDLAGGAPSVLVTGTADHVSRVCARLSGLGVRAVGCPYLIRHPLPFDFIFSELEKFTWLVFTSAGGVCLFFERAKALRVDWRAFGNKRFAAIGAHTADSLAKYGFLADLMPNEYTAKGLKEALCAAGAEGERVLLLRASSGSAALDPVGVRVDLYQTRPDPALLSAAAASLLHVRAVTFGSASGVRALLDFVDLPAGVRSVCVGEETAKELAARGFAPVVCARPGADELAAAVCAVLEEKECND